MIHLNLNKTGSTRPDPNATISDAVDYVSKNPGGLTYVVNGVKWLIGLVGALLKPAGPRK